MRGFSEDAPADVVESVNTFKYREAFHLTKAQLREEPIEDIKEALLIWSLRDEHRVKLEKER